ncbi:fibronectin type III domain-containing protein [Cellulomonas sp. SG140]|uniref:fibronectin type III domain-containing protein n=1 Tax=Cellulomonas sp. SG140 TaxID=2976536 RepID=UPI0021E87585|nr:fibronectin type III domain-containing protein [Cellulomonas sp. SG140]
MAETGIQWGGWSSKARIGVNVRWEDIGAGTTQSHVYADFYYGTNGWGYNGDYTLSFGGSLGGSWGYHFYSPSGGSVTTFIGTYDIGVQGTSYSGGPSWTFAASTGPLYDGARPSVSVGFTLPARPPSPPDPPGIGHGNVSSNSASIYVYQPGDVHGAGVDAYEAYVMTNNAWPGQGGNVVASAAGGSFNAYGLQRATTYYYTAHAHNAAGWSGWAAMGVFTTLATVPDAPTNVSVGSIQPDTALVSWTAPYDGGSTLTNYNVQVATDAAFTTNVQTFTTGALSGLIPGTVQYVRVRAGNAMGWGAWSSTVSFTTLSGGKVKVNGSWVNAKVWIKVNGAWVPGKVYKKANGAWKL